MIGIIAIAIIAGSASALMFASIISGALVSLVLLYLAPLPLMVSALSWGPLCASIGGIVAATGLGAIFGLPYCISFALMVAVPAWWLGHLAMLGRVATAPADMSGTADQIVWYPVGRILLWIAGFAALTTIAALLTLGTEASAITDALRQFLLRLTMLRGSAPVSDAEQWIIDALVNIAPPMAAMIAMPTLAINLWLAGKITATSGRLHRPWPDLMSVTLPPMTLVALCLAMAFCFTGGLPAILARIITASLMMAYALTGFAVLHTVTLTLRSRAFWLAASYVIVVMFTWPIAALVLLGLADAIFGVRERFLRSRPPPLPAP